MKQGYLPIEELLVEPGQYLAHTEGGRTETLKEHTLLARKYFERLLKERGMDQIIQRFRNLYLPDLSLKGKEFFQSMVMNLVVFHDLGKINPLFQKDIMKNKNSRSDFTFPGIASEHSIVSAILYLDYFKKELNELKSLKEQGRQEGLPDKKERLLLRRFIVFHSYLIARHHSSLEKMEDYLASFQMADNEKRDGKAIGLIGAIGENSHKICCWGFSMHKENTKWVSDRTSEYMNRIQTHQAILLFGYLRLLYSMLVTADYYATNQFVSGTTIKDFGDMGDVDRLCEIFNQTEIMKKVRSHEKEYFPMSGDELKKEKDMNKIRSEILLEAEGRLKDNRESHLFYLEAPTGSGKSNVAIDLSFQLMKQDSRLRKIYFVYPFNTLVEQNKDILYKIFEDHEDIVTNLAVINSTTPMKQEERERQQADETGDPGYFRKVLLDRQFMNYPLVLTTHVSLFEIMFGNGREPVFGFQQLCNSVIVLDEIQSYRNQIWGEVINLLDVLAPLMNCRIIIMSATLPNLHKLVYGNGEERLEAGERGTSSGLDMEREKAVNLIENREKYFNNPCFRDRVRISYELLEAENSKEALWNHVVENIESQKGKGKKLLVEFIRKKTAETFYKSLCEELGGSCRILYMSGDDNIYDRAAIIKELKEWKKPEPLILVATQVIENGVDIDMDIGYKDVSKLDGEEQFLGRINRSHKKEGVAYFFKWDNALDIYGQDTRVDEELTILNEDMRKYLENKDFAGYYDLILQNKIEKMEDTSEDGMQHFLEKTVAHLDFPKISSRMKLIEENRQMMSVFLCRIFQAGDRVLDGKEIWTQYKELLMDGQMDYSKKRVLLSEIGADMNVFVYQIRYNADLIYNDRIGDLLCIEDGEKFFYEGKLDRAKLQGEIGDFVDFI